MREELLKEYAEEALKNGPHRFIRPDDKVFYLDGFKDGYNLGLKAKINKTTISDAPALPGEEIAELEDKLANADYQLEGRDLEIKELKAQIEKNDKFLKVVNYEAEKVPMLEAQIEKAKNQWNCENNGYCVSSICPCDKWELRR